MWRNNCANLGDVIPQPKFLKTGNSTSTIILLAKDIIAMPQSFLAAHLYPAYTDRSQSLRVMNETSVSPTEL